MVKQQISKMIRFLFFILFVHLKYCVISQVNTMPPSPTHNHPGEGNQSKAVQPPHGGIIVESGKLNIEILFDPFGGEQKLCVWVLNQRNKIKTIINAKAFVTLNYKNGTVIKKDMESKEDMFFSDVADLKNPFNAVIVVFLKKCFTSSTLIL